jgi:hypothetical protein
MSDELKRLTDYISNWLEQSFGREMSDFSVFVLMRYIDNLAQLMDTINIIYRDVIEKLSSGLETITDDREGMASFSLYLTSSPTFNQFILKLDAVNAIYNELAQIMDISVTDNPILIRKVESGSVWQDILGYPKIIDFLQRLIENAVGYFYRNFTQEGKISTLPRNVEAIESVLHLRKELKACGINTEQIDDILNKSSVIIAEKLNTLLIGEPKVTINEKEYSVGDEFAAVYLEASKSLLLGTGNGNDLLR